MKYKPLFKIAIRHTYYSDRRCPDFGIEASAQTETLFRNHRCVLKTQADGLAIFISVDDEERPFIPLSPEAVFLFYLQLQNQEFSFFTDLSSFTQNESPLFSNTDLISGEKVLPLSARLATPAEVFSNQARGIFAEIAIHTNNSLLAKGAVLSEAPTFQIDFSAKEARWLYYCVTDLSPSLGELTIEDKRPSVSDRLMFSAQNRKDIDVDLDPRDEVALMLRAQYPTFRKLRFLSDDLVPCRQAASQQIAFSVGENRLSEALPNPSFKNNAKVSVMEGNTPKEEDALFQVIKYLTV